VLLVVVLVMFVQVRMHSLVVRAVALTYLAQTAPETQVVIPLLRDMKGTGFLILDTTAVEVVVLAQIPVGQIPVMVALVSKMIIAQALMSIMAVEGAVVRVVVVATVAEVMVVQVAAAQVTSIPEAEVGVLNGTREIRQQVDRE
jgi:hypothetical protein